MFTRQDAAMAISKTVIPPEHAEKMLQMALGKYHVTPSKKAIEKKLSPQAIACRHEFLSETEEPLYSVGQVQTLLSALVGEKRGTSRQPPPSVLRTRAGHSGCQPPLTRRRRPPSTPTRCSCLQPVLAINWRWSARPRAGLSPSSCACHRRPRFRP